MPPADLNGLVRFAERRNLVSALVPSHFNWPLLSARKKKGNRFSRNAGIAYLPNCMTSQYRIPEDMRTSGGRKKQVWQWRLDVTTFSLIKFCRRFGRTWYLFLQENRSFKSRSLVRGDEKLKDRQCTYNLTLRRVPVTIAAVEKQ